jgi:hypothetical protein
MAALAGVVHNRKAASDREHNSRENNQQGGFHCDLTTAGPAPFFEPNTIIFHFEPGIRALARLRKMPEARLALA